MMPRHIAIIGAGPAGLLLARMLHLHQMPFTVFERDVSSISREQGGTLDLHPETGQHSLIQAGLFDGFQALARYEGQETRLYDTQGRLLMRKLPEGDNRPEIDRRDLRDLLLRSIPDDAIRWGHALAAVAPYPSGGVELRFAHGPSARFDYLVGADGAWSKVRPAVSAATPTYVGSTLFELSIADADARHPVIAAFVGHGTALIEDGRKAIILQRNSNGDIRLYAGVTLADDRGGDAIAVSKAAIATDFGDWGGIVPTLFAAAGEAVRPWPIYALPAGHRWEPHPCITLIGDAAHVMPPAGEGANLALLDAVGAADALCDGQDRVAALRRFEAAMFERSEAAATRAMAVMSQGIDMKEAVRLDE